MTTLSRGTAVSRVAATPLTRDSRGGRKPSMQCNLGCFASKAGEKCGSEEYRVIGFEVARGLREDEADTWLAEEALRQPSPEGLTAQRLGWDSAVGRFGIGLNDID